MVGGPPQMRGINALERPGQTQSGVPSLLTQRSVERPPPARNAPTHSAPPLEPETAAFSSDALHVNPSQLKHACVGFSS